LEYKESGHILFCAHIFSLDLLSDAKVEENLHFELVIDVIMCLKPQS